MIDMNNLTAKEAFHIHLGELVVEYNNEEDAALTVLAQNEDGLGFEDCDHLLDAALSNFSRDVTILVDRFRNKFGYDAAEVGK